MQAGGRGAYIAEGSSSCLSCESLLFKAFQIDKGMQS